MSDTGPRCRCGCGGLLPGKLTPPQPDLAVVLDRLIDALEQIGMPPREHPCARADRAGVKVVLLEERVERIERVIRGGR